MYIIIIFSVLISFAAQSYVKSNYAKFSKIRIHRQITGAQVAQEILEKNGITDVRVIQSSGGVLSDHYDPTKNTVALSPEVFQNASIASIAVAAHEVGHAIQYATNYPGISLRNLLLKPAIIASQFSQLAIVIGLGLMTGESGNPFIFNLGITMIGIIAAFQIATLPVEFDASKRALAILKAEGYVDESELDGASTMLNAAALTYIAAVLGTLANLLYYIMIGNRRKNNR